MPILVAEDRGSAPVTISLGDVREALIDASSGSAELVITTTDRQYSLHDSRQLKDIAKYLLDHGEPRAISPFEMPPRRPVGLLIARLRACGQSRFPQRW